VITSEPLNASYISEKRKKEGKERSGKKRWTVWNTIGFHEPKNSRPHLWELRARVATHLAISGLRRKFRHICHLVIINGTFLLF